MNPVTPSVHGVRAGSRVHDLRPRYPCLGLHTGRTDIRGPGRLVGAIESFIEGNSDSCRQTSATDYKFYGAWEYNSCIKGSPHRNLWSRSSRNSNSIQNRMSHQQAPVYENIDYYSQLSQPHPPYYHPVESRKSPKSSPRGSVASESYRANI